MSRIINPNAPRKSALDQIVDTMHIIAQYRKSFFDLEALKQWDGVAEPLTATQLVNVEEAQQALMQDMVEFILYGANPNGNRTANIQTPNTCIEDNAQESTQPAQGLDQTPRTVVIGQSD